MADGLLIPLEYDFLIFDGNFSEPQLDPSPRYLGIGLLDKPLNPPLLSKPEDGYLGIGLLDKPLLEPLQSSPEESYLGIGLLDISLHNDNISSPEESYLGIGLLDISLHNDNISSPEESYLGIGLLDISLHNDNISSPEESYLGIGLLDKIIRDDLLSEPEEPYLGIGLLDKPFVTLHSKTFKNLKDGEESESFEDLFDPSTGELKEAWLRFTNPKNKIKLLQPKNPPNNWLFSNLKSYKTIELPHNKKSAPIWKLEDNAKDKNNPNNPIKEAPRLLTHLILDPIYKPALSSYYLTYTLEIDVAKTSEQKVTYHYIYNQTFNNTSEIIINHNQDTFLESHIFVNDQIIRPTSIINDKNTITLTLSEPLSGIVKLYDIAGFDMFIEASMKYLFEYEKYDAEKIWTIQHNLDLFLTADVYIDGFKIIPLRIDSSNKNITIIEFNTPQKGIAKLF